MLEIAEDWRARLVREVRRKAIHISGLSVPLGLIFLGRTATAGAIALALLFSLLIEVQRLRGRISLPEVREHEKTRVGSYIYYMAGSLLTVLLFPQTIAITAMLFLALGDTVSGLAGSILKNCDVRAAPAPVTRCSCGWGWPIKPIPVVAATFAACAVIGALASSFTALPPPVYICGALGAAFADGVAVIVRGRSLDDNFSIPMISGALMSGAVLVLGPLEKVF